MSDPRRILVVRTDRLGDVILTLPMLALLRSRYPDAYLGMLLSRYTGEIVRNHPSVNVLLWNDEGGQPRPAADIVREIRAQQFRHRRCSFIRPPGLHGSWHAPGSRCGSGPATGIIPCCSHTGSSNTGRTHGIMNWNTISGS